MTAKVLSLAELRNHGKAYPFDVEGLGTVMLAPLTHGQRQMLIKKYYTTDGVVEFQDFRDEVVLLAVTEPKLTREDLAAFADDVDFVQQVYEHAAAKAGLIKLPATKGEEGVTEDDAPLTPTTS